MAKLIKCTACGNQIAQRTPACPQCGQPNKQSEYLPASHVFLGLLMAAGGIWFMATRGSSDSSVTAPAAAHRASVPMLQLKSYRCAHEYGYTTLVGEVVNITPLKLKGVMAVASHYTRAQELITTDDSLIDYQPILPGQTSPFKVMTTYNPAMASCSVNFKLMSGGAIPWKQKDGTVVN